MGRRNPLEIRKPASTQDHKKGLLLFLFCSLVVLCNWWIVQWTENYFWIQRARPTYNTNSGAKTMFTSQQEVLDSGNNKTTTHNTRHPAINQTSTKGPNKREIKGEKRREVIIQKTSGIEHLLFRPSASSWIGTFDDYWAGLIETASKCLYSSVSIERHARGKWRVYIHFTCLKGNNKRRSMIKEINKQNKRVSLLMDGRKTNRW